VAQNSLVTQDASRARKDFDVLVVVVLFLFQVKTLLHCMDRQIQPVEDIFFLLLVHHHPFLCQMCLELCPVCSQILQELFACLDPQLAWDSALET